MKTATLIAALISMLLLTFSSFSQKMNNQKLIKHLSTECDSISGNEGNWQLFYRGIVVLAITDENTNRIKLLSPIAYTKDVNSEVIGKCMEANFENLKDVKYAISNDIIWSVFDHDFRLLSTEQIDEAILQVYFSTGTFGGNYSSSDISIAENK